MEPPENAPQTDRRSLLQRVGSYFMGLGLLAGYGTFAGFAARFLYRTESVPDWTYIALVATMRSGESLHYETPSGAGVSIVRQGELGTIKDFIALSSVCPHLGCKVHWEGHKSRFFCPCHNGTFDPRGAPTGGPPLSAKQQLPRFDLRLADGMLFIRLPATYLAAGPGWVTPKRSLRVVA